MEKARLKLLEKQRIKDQEREDAWCKKLEEQGKERTMLLQKLEDERQEVEKEIEVKLAEQWVKDKRTKKIEEAVKNFTKLERIETLEEGLNDLEAVLEVEGANEGDWLRHLKTALMGKPADILQSLCLPPDIPYGEAKDDLFHKCGITAKSW